MNKVIKIIAILAILIFAVYWGKTIILRMLYKTDYRQYVEKYAEKYTFDPVVQEWLRDVNPWALQRMTEILLEAEQRGLWQAKPETKEELQKLYLEMEGELEDRADEH